MPHRDIGGIIPPYAPWLPIKFLFEYYFKLYEKAQKMGAKELTANAKALKYASIEFQKINLEKIFRHQEKIDRQQRAVKEILITFGFNDSDNTVGWKLYKNAMTMYYLHPTQKFIQEEHSFPLVPGLERVQSNFIL